jgi:hypothetical protein
LSMDVGADPFFVVVYQHRFETRHMERVVDIVKSNRCVFHTCFSHTQQWPETDPPSIMAYAGCTTASIPWGARAGAPTSFRRCSRHVFHFYRHHLLLLLN